MGKIAKLQQLVINREELAKLQCGRYHGGKEGYIENLAEMQEDDGAQLQQQGDKVAYIENKRKPVELQRQGKEGDKIGYINRKSAQLQRCK